MAHRDAAAVVTGTHGRRAAAAVAWEAEAEPSTPESLREEVSFFRGHGTEGGENGAQVVELSGGSDDIGDCKP